MTTGPDLPRPVDPTRMADIEAAADAALLAPSVHNTQPWLLVLHPDRIDVRADRSRRLPVLDPAGRELMLSVGAAVLNTRVELAARGRAVEVDRSARTTDPDLAAVVHLVDGPPDSALAALAPQVRARRTNRRGYTDDPVPPDVLDRVLVAAAAEDTVAVPVLTEDQHRLVARLAQDADAEQNADPAYRHELRIWTNRDTRSGDGVPSTTVPRVDGSAQDDVPVRDFDTRGLGALPAATRAGRTGALVVLASHADDERAWVRAGEAMERVLLELTADGWAAGPLSQVTEVPRTRASLGRELCWGCTRSCCCGSAGRCPPRPAPDEPVTRWSAAAPDLLPDHPRPLPGPHRLARGPRCTGRPGPARSSPAGVRRTRGDDVGVSPPPSVVVGVDSGPASTAAAREGAAQARRRLLPLHLVAGAPSILTVIPSGGAGGSRRRSRWVLGRCSSGSRCCRTS
ncbi:Acg family FMN-binding oxidoreductase [Klenkia terrae]|uniref:Acg family FMN-binding oxidoreductase n=1 Tax=Klenkia terrae TaxID=1052259 RepID=UPI0036119091